MKPKSNKIPTFTLVLVLLHPLDDESSRANAADTMESNNSLGMPTPGLEPAMQPIPTSATGGSGPATRPRAARHFNAQALLDRQCQWSGPV